MSSYTAGRRTTIALGTVVVLTWGSVYAVALREDAPPPPVVPAAATRPPLLGPPSQAPLPSSSGLQAALAAGLRDPALGGGVAVSVLDAQTGGVVLEQGATRAVTPASTAKIATAVAALSALPPAQRLTTTVVAGAAQGEVVLVGGGDVSLAGRLSRPGGYPRVARLSDLAAQVKKSLGAAAVTRVLVDDSLYSGPLLGPGWRPGYVTAGDVAPVTALMVDGGRTAPSSKRAPRVADPSLAAGGQLAALLGVRGAPVVRVRAAPAARVLGSVTSPTVAELVEEMLSRSDNDLAEALARQVAITRGRPASFAGAAAALGEVLTAELDRAGAPARSLALLDGSGLSRLSRAQPAALTRLLAAAAGAQRERLAPVLAGLPVGGFDGTLDERYRSGPAAAAAGVVRAKTGTLNGVGALAGLVRTRSGRLLAFDLTANAVPAGGTRAAQAALDRLAAAIARCGCP